MFRQAAWGTSSRPLPTPFRLKLTGHISLNGLNNKNQKNSGDNMDMRHGLPLCFLLNPEDFVKKNQ